MRLREFEEERVNFDNLSQKNQKILLNDSNFVKWAHDEKEFSKLLSHLIELSKNVDMNSEKAVTRFLDVCNESIRNIV